MRDPYTRVSPRPKTARPLIGARAGPSPLLLGWVGGRWIAAVTGKGVPGGGVGRAGRGKIVDVRGGCVPPASEPPPPPPSPAAVADLSCHGWIRTDRPSESAPRWRAELRLSVRRARAGRIDLPTAAVSDRAEAYPWRVTRSVRPAKTTIAAPALTSPMEEGRAPPGPA